MENYLIHRSHKYKKREWQGSRWRYWYDYDLTGQGYIDDSDGHRLAARTLRVENKHLEDNARWDQKHNLSKSGSSLYTTLRETPGETPSGYHKSIEIGNSSNAAEQNAKRIKTLEAKAEVDWARYEKYSVKGRAEKKAKDILKKIGNMKVSDLLKKK